MTNRQLDNRIKKLQDIEAQIKDLQDQANEIKDEIKADLEEKSLEELATGNFIIRWKMIFSNRFDSKSFKTDHPKLYEKYTSSSASMRFTIV